MVDLTLKEAIFFSLGKRRMGSKAKRREKAADVDRSPTKKREKSLAIRGGKH